MLAELFILRIEAILRASTLPSPTSSDNRFVPIKLPPPTAKGAPTPITKNT
jgi:hypothetical protein